LDISNAGSYEIGPIRPPSEAYSLFVRVSRNCPWNRCKFCHIYKGSRFEIRAVGDIKRDIDAAKKCYDAIKEAAERMGYGDDIGKAAGVLVHNAPNEAFNNVATWVFAGGENVFIQDANSLILPAEQLLEVLQYLKSTFPGIRRITSYARSHTAARKTVQELKQLHEAGLSRLHMGLESGYDPVLGLMDKGVTAAEHIKGGKNVVASGISLCEYVLVGVGGKKMWPEHAAATGRVLSEINPDYIRVRTLTINNQMPLFDEVANGNFIRSNDEDMIREERMIIENLNCNSNFISDHTTNLLQELEGKLPGDKEKLLAIIDRFLGLSREDKIHFELGRRIGVYYYLDDIEDQVKRKAVEQYTGQLIDGKPEAIERVIWKLMERFI
jgi:radical SAM superfamily enzyme YgiQ (UPF0313 family)